MFNEKVNKKIKRLPIVFQVDLRSFSEDEEMPKEIQVLPVGKWNHPSYGPIVITKEDISIFKENFDKGLRKDIPITEGHEGFDEKPAVGWFVELIDKEDKGLYASVNWTEKGKTLLSEKSYKYFSPEFYSEYDDPETREIYENVLVGGALTNKPYFKELEAVVLSENIINNKLNFNDMDIKEILAKKVEELSAEEKTFLQENKGQLNEEQLATFGSVFEKEETDEEKKAREEKEAGDANEAKGLNRDGSAKKTELTDEEKAANVEKGLNEDGTEKTPVEDPKPTEDPKPAEASEFKMNEKGEVVMTAAQAKALSEKANAGYEASEKLRKSEVKSLSDKLVFSEQNSKGKILPKNEQKVFSFMLGLTEAQRKTFAELVESIPSSQLFKEKGKSNAIEGSAFSEIDTKAKKLMSEDKGLAYSDAVNKVCSENKDLAKRYESEL